MYYAETSYTNGRLEFVELHAFATRDERDEWIEAPICEDFSLIELDDRTAVHSECAKERAKDDYYEGYVIHGYRAKTPQWLDNATDGNGTMSQQSTPYAPNCPCWWSNIIKN